MGNILSLIETNINLNSKWVKGKVEVKELDFYKSNYSEELASHLQVSNLIIAADGKHALNSLYLEINEIII